MLRKVKNMEELKDIFYEASRGHAQSVAVEMTIPNVDATEFIINRYKNIKNKIKFYERTFDQDLVNKKAPGIRIISAGYGDADLWNE